MTAEEEKFGEAVKPIPESEYISLTNWKPRAVQMEGYFNIEELELILQAMKVGTFKMKKKHRLDTLETSKIEQKRTSEPCPFCGMTVIDSELAKKVLKQIEESVKTEKKHR